MRHWVVFFCLLGAIPAYSSSDKRVEDRTGTRSSERQEPQRLELDLDAAQTPETLDLTAAPGGLSLEPDQTVERLQDAPAARVEPTAAPAAFTAKPESPSRVRTQQGGDEPARQMLPATISRDTFRDDAQAERWLRSTFDLSDDKLWEAYLGLDTPQREAVRRLVATEFASEADAKALSSRGLEKANDAASSIRGTFSKPGDVVATVGRSMLLPARLVALQDDSPGRFKYLAFTSSRDRNGDFVYLEPTPSQLKGFRAYLKRLGLDPQSIASRKGRTAFVDYVSSGNSMAYLMKVLFDWSAELGLMREVAMNTWVGYATSNPEIYSTRFMPARAKKLRLDGPARDALENGTYTDIFGVVHPREYWDDQMPEEVVDERREALGRFHLIDYLVRQAPADPPAASSNSTFTLAKNWALRALGRWSNRAGGRS